MAELERKVHLIRRRLTVFVFVEALAWGLLAAAALATLYVLIQRLFNVAAEPLAVTGGLAGAALVFAAVWTWRRRLSAVQAALAADDKLGLRERLSSALLLHGRRDDSGAIEALEADALRHAAAIQPRRDFRWKAPRALVHLVWPTAAFVGLYLFMPQLDLLAKPAPPGQRLPDAATQAAEERVRKEVSRDIKELARELKEKKQEDLEAIDDAKFARELERLADDLYLGTKDRKAAVAELSRMADEVRMERRDLALKAEPFKQINGLQRAEQTRNIQQDMKDLRFEDAGAKMEQMSQQLSQMSAEQTEQLAAEMQKMAGELKDNKELSESMQKSAEALKQLAEAKRQDEQRQQSGQQQQQQQQAGGQQSQQQSGQQQQQQQGQQQGQQQQASQQAQQQNQQQQGSQQSQSGQQDQQGGQQNQQASQQGGGQQQQQGGSQSMQQSQATSDAMSQAAQQMQQAAQQMGNQQQLMKEMARLDQVSQQLGQARASLLNQQGQSSQSGEPGPSGGQPNPQGGSQQGQGSGQGSPQSGEGDQPGQGTGNQPGQGRGNGQGQGQWQQGDSQAQGTGPGGLGRGSGERPDAGLVDTMFHDEMIRGQKNDGEILATIDIDAPALKGESNVRYTQIYSTRQQKAADAMRQSEIPLGYRNAVKDYFEAINPQKRAPQ